MSREEFFDNLFNDATPAAEDIRALRQLAYEERVIKRIFSECGVRVPSWGRIANECRAATGDNKISFRWFNSDFKKFPALLAGKRIPHIHGIKLPELFKPAAKNKLLKSVLRALHGLEIDPTTSRSYVFVFPLIKTPFCAHNLLSAGYAHPEDTSRLQFIFRAERGASHIFIEPLTTACAAIGADWYMP